MKVLLTLLFHFTLSAFARQPETPPLQYKLELIENKLHVELEYHPVEKDSSVFTYGQPAFGGQMDILKGLQNLSVKAPARLKLDSLTRTITVYFSSSQPLYISYDIADTRTVANTRSQLFRPMILPDYLFIHGINLFLSPVFRSADLRPLVSVRWKKLPPFPLFLTFDPDNDGSQTTITTADSLEMRFITGASALLIKKFRTGSGTNYLVLRSTGMPAKTISGLEKFYTGYNRVMRQYWKDKRKINYSLVMQPYLGVNHKISGVSFGNGFIGKYNTPDSLAIGERKFVVAHEIGHYYLGELKAFEGANNEGQWFGEGFNDYTTYFTMLRAGEMSPEEFITNFNETLQHLYQSPIRNTPNVKIFENFWKLGDYAKLPYWRGCVFAFYLDNQIALATNNKNSIRDLMLDLQARVSTRTKKEFSNEEFIQAVSRFLPREKFEPVFQEHILQGTPMPLENNLLMPVFKLTYVGGVPVLTIVDKKKFMDHFQFH